MHKIKLVPFAWALNFAFAAIAVVGVGSEARAQAYANGQVFRDCAAVCPEMVVVPSGSFLMGSPAGVGDDDERPQRER